MYQPYHRVAAVGMTQSGKTTFVRKAIVPGLGRYVIYDPDFQFDELEDQPYEARVVDNYNEFKRLFPTYPRIVFQPREEMDLDFDARVLEFNQICYDINALPEGNLTFIVDEIAHITLKRNTASIPREFQRMIARREKAPFRVGVIFTTQRPKHACLDLLSQVRHIYAFRLFTKDIDYVEDSFPIRIRDLIGEMEQYSCIHYDIDEGLISVERWGEDEQKINIGKTFSVLGPGSG